MLRFENKKGHVVLEMNDQGEITKQTLPLKEKVDDSNGERTEGNTKNKAYANDEEADASN